MERFLLGHYPLKIGKISSETSSLLVGGGGRVVGTWNDPSSVRTK